MEDEKGPYPAWMKVLFVLLVLLTLIVAAAKFQGIYILEWLAAHLSAAIQLLFGAK